MKTSLASLMLTFGLLGYAALANQGKAPEAADVNYDRDVAPILSQHCYKCHGPDAAKAAAGLRLDNFAGATKNLGDGAAVVPGSPDKSLLIQRVTASEDMRMPPADSGVKPLTKQQIEIVRTWIKGGGKFAKHWSYVPPTMPAIPKVKQAGWAKDNLDEFVLAKLEQNGMKPESEADKDTLATRAAEALTGLPPTPKQLDAYRQDTKPGAYERFVDRLMAEPEYGEQQARYWLDAVRYADTHGLQLDNERQVYPYRDWVVDEINKDLPFDKFVKWQIAGDMLPHPTTEQLVATGYVRMNLTSNEGGAIADEFLARNTFDRVDTTSTVMLGLTVQCAKCHDHKYDPIKQKDYYGLYAYFDSTTDDPLDGNIALPTPIAPAASPEQDAELTHMSRTLDSLRDKVQFTTINEWFDTHHKAGPASRDWQATPVYSSDTFDKAFDTPEPGEPGQPAANWKKINFEPGKDQPSLVGKDNSSIYVKGTITVPQAQTIVLGVSSDDAVKVWLNGKLIHSHKISRGLNQGIDKVKADFKAGDNELIAKEINGGGPDGLNIRLTDQNDQRIDEAMKAYRKMPSSSQAAKDLRSTFLELGPSSPESVEFKKITEAKAKLVASIPMTLVAQEMPAPRPTHILKRGQYDQPGDLVTRHLPAFLGTLPAGAPNNRLGFADWLTSPSNPLLARVFVNRVWQRYFGTGIVKTVDDFGSQGEWPLNQPLLDYLAVSFERNGWSMKKLNRMIVTSAAFRQSSRITPAKLAKDPENRLCSRGPRFRLDAEEIRDKALAVGGLLYEDLGGRGMKPYQPRGIWENASDPASGTHVYMRDRGKEIYRRSIYIFWKRTAPPPEMVTFDAPLRDTCIVRRSTTNTPLQALEVMNEPSFLEASRTMGLRLLQTKGDDAKRIEVAYNITLGRPPHADELAIIKHALARYRAKYDRDPKAAQELLKVGDTPQSTAFPVGEQATWMLVASTLMNTDEFISLH